MPVGKIFEFNPNTDDFESWAGVLTNYLLANEIDEARGDAAMKRKAIAILLPSIGVSTYGLLQSLVSLAKPEEKTFGELIEVLKKHYKPTPKTIAERYKFYKRIQQPGESINIYLSELRKIGVTCIRSEAVQKRLFLEDDNLTLDMAVKIATSQEAADSSTQLIRHNNSLTTVIDQTNKVKSSSPKQYQYTNKNPVKIKQGKLTCSGCGEKHIKKDCPHKEVICHRCNKSDHFARRCLSQPKGEGGEGKHKTNQINNVKQVSHDSPIMINVRLNGIPMDLELDTASEEFSDVFDKPVGTIKDFKAKLILKEDATPRFFKSRPVPFALRDKVDEELEKMEKSGVISRIETSEWASPLVVVSKPNGAIRITGDFKRTINNQLHVQQYPLTRVEEIFESNFY
ncbi:PREDICTED: uncharacterized protein LOC108759161 [Trachymyrmex cornetzi]|uniref:uncharacterized protein LOC108759161 n=1 Tax=Trachymyrmex cornetzi TaxID=471704 RepID=UPI00084EF886|nr:PREDICTED: uncharacterized protein LOC108759161 [Trachymyrmex cornetzi]